MIHLLENGLFKSMDRTLIFVLLFLYLWTLNTSEKNFKNSVRKKKICKPIGREMEYLGFFCFFLIEVFKIDLQC